MRYQFIRDHAAQYPVTVLCHVLQISTSGYYAWRRCPESARTQEDRRLLTSIQAHHTQSRQTFPNGNTMSFAYGDGYTTTETRDVHGVVIDTATYFFDDKQRRTGIANVNGHRTITKYEDLDNPYKPTTIIRPRWA